MVQGQTVGDKASNLASQAKEYIPGTNEHKAAQAYGSTGTTTGNTFGSDVNSAAHGNREGAYTTSAAQPGFEGQHTHGTHTHHSHTHNGQHEHNAGNLGSGAVGAATGGNFGSTVDTPHQTAYDGVAKHVPGTDAHDVHSANREVGRGDQAGQPSLTDNVRGAAGKVTGGTVGSTVNTPEETTKEKILKHIPGTEANKEKKAQQQTGL